MARDSLYPVSVKAGKPILGMLPTGWQKLSLEKCLNIEARKAYIQDNQEYDLVTVKRSRGGVIRREHLKGKDISVKSQFYIKEGDFLISKRQIVHGACGLVPKELSGSIVSNEYCVLTGKSGFYLPYMEFLSESLYFQQTCFHSSIGVHIEKMIFKLDSWFKWPFNIPPLSEQKRIVKILSTWDKAISVTEKLLANSQQQKKALMQQLLTGKKRLLDENGVRFSGEWEVVRLKQLIHEEKKRNRDNHIQRVLSVTNHSGFVLPEEQFSKRVASEDVSTYKIVKKNQYGYNPSRLNVGSFARLDNYDEGVLSPMYVVFSINHERLNSDYFLNWMSSNEAKQRIAGSTQGSVRDSVGFDALCSFSFSLPTLMEQQKIAAVLSAADAEMSMLEKKLACLKEEKKALMQQLLTGKRRVNVESEETVSA